MKDRFDLSGGFTDPSAPHTQTLAKKQGKSASFHNHNQPSSSSSTPSFLSSSNNTAVGKDTGGEGRTKRGNKALDEFMSVMKGTDGMGLTVEDKEKAGEKVGETVGETVGEDEVDEGEVDDAEWLRRRQAAVVADDPPQAQANGGPPSTSPEQSLILSTHRLFLRNLSFHTTPTSLRQFLAPYIQGGITEIHLPLNKEGGSLGTAFVGFEKGEDALRVWREGDGRTVMGRLVHVLPGRGKFGAGGGAGQGAGADGSVVLEIPGSGAGAGV